MGNIKSKRLTLEMANKVISATFAEGHSMGLPPLTVAVLDAGGHIISLQREDGSSIMRPEIAVGKASTALAMGFSSRKVGDIADKRPSFIASLGSISPKGIVPVAGGLLIGDSDKNVLGAIGVSGDLSSDNDEQCALVGIAAVELFVLD